MPTREVRVSTAAGKLRQTVQVAGHTLIADEPTDAGGEDTGPAPHEWVLAGLGACTSMTLKMYAERKGWPLGDVDVRLVGRRDAGGVYVIERRITLEGALDAEQRARLLDVASRCPVHRTLTGTIRVDTELA